jgi:predicted dehydrogenase
LPEALAHYPRFDSFEAGMETGPDFVVIATYSDSHADLAIAAMEAGAHVFVEKPLATTVADAERVVDRARASTESSSWATSCATIPAGPA